MFSLYWGLPKAVYVLFFATIINGVGVFVYPFLVLLLTQYLGYSDTWAGLFLSFTALVYLPSSLLGGKLADRIGRKKVMVVGQLLACSMFAVCGFLGPSKLVPLFIILNLAFDGLTDPARGALLTDVTNSSNRQASFSLTYLGHNLGFAFGPILAGFLFYRAHQWLFFGNAIAAFIATLFVIFNIAESKPSQKEIEESFKSETNEKSVDGGLLKALFSRPKLLVFAICATFYSFAYAQALFALPLYTTALFGKNGASLYGRMMAINAVVVVLSNTFLVMILRKRHPLRNVAVAGIFYTIGFTFMGFVTSSAVLYLLAVIYTLGEVMEATNSQYYIANNTPLNHRGRFSAVFPLIIGTGHAVAPMVGGFVSTYFGLKVLWLMVGFSALIGTVGISVLYFTEFKKN
jgi:MFS family permease